MPDEWVGKDGSIYRHYEVEPHESGGIQWGSHLILREFPELRATVRRAFMPTSAFFTAEADRLYKVKNPSGAIRKALNIPDYPKHPK